jgi:hypothetical protein
MDETKTFITRLDDMAKDLQKVELTARFKEDIDFIRMDTEFKAMRGYAFYKECLEKNKVA